MSGGGSQALFRGGGSPRMLGASVAEQPNLIAKSDYFPFAGRFYSQDAPLPANVRWQRTTRDVRRTAGAVEGRSSGHCFAACGDEQPYAVRMENPASSRQSATPAWTPAGAALAGVVVAVLGGLLLAQAGGSDRELFVSLGLTMEAVGLLGIISGGVAIGIKMARD